MTDQKTILIAEDDPDIQSLLLMRLEVAGFNVIAVDNGEEALRKIKEDMPDMVILDLMLPKINGFDLCRMIRFDDKYKDVPIMVLSALAQPADIKKAMDNGANGYFIKSTSLKLLIDKVADFLNHN